MTYRPFWCGVSIAASLVTAGCHGAPQILVGQEYVGRRVVRYALVPSSETSEDVGPLFDLKMVVCDAGKGEAETRCAESIVLQNVAPIAE